jgi:hypothetical protein
MKEIFLNVAGWGKVKPELYVFKWDDCSQISGIPSLARWLEKTTQKKKGIANFFSSKDNQMNLIDTMVAHTEKLGIRSPKRLFMIYSCTAVWLRKNAKHGSIKASAGERNQYMAVSDLQSIAGYKLHEILQAESVGDVERKLIAIYGKELSVHGKGIDLSPQTGLPKDTVKYLAAEERARYRLTVQTGLLYKFDWVKKKVLPYDTSQFNACDAGQGFGIFVMDFDSIFSGAHDGDASSEHNPWSGYYGDGNQRFYHSAFLGGGDVLAAGEMKVESGRLVAVTQKSGHYQPGIPQLKLFMSRLKFLGVNTDNVEIAFGYQPDGPPAVKDPRLNQGAVPAWVSKCETKWKYYTTGRFIHAHQGRDG